MGQPKIPPTPAGTTLAGKTALITGANSGLGLETARQYLLLGIERLVVTARTTAKGKETISTLRSDPEVVKVNPDATIDAFELELEDYSSVTKFCERVKAEVPTLHILLNNAGLTINDFKLSKDGHERSMQVHVYAPFLISHILLPHLQATARTTGQPTRLTIVGSSTHYQSTLISTTPSASPTAYLDVPQNFPGVNRYQDSKMAVALCTRELAERVDPTEVIVNNFCPGMVTTHLGRDLPVYYRPVLWAFRKMNGSRDVEEGARTYVYATAVLGEESHGRFVFNNEIKSDDEKVTSEAGQRLGKQLWKEMEEEWKRLGV